MMRLVGLLVASTLLATPAFAGKDPCKGVSVKKDSFGETRALDAGDLRLRKTGDSWTLIVKFTSGGGLAGFGTKTSFDTVAAGTPVQFALADGSIVEVASSAAANTQTSTIYGGAVVQYFEIPTILTTDQVKALAAQAIKGVRVVDNGVQKMATEIKGGDSGKFQTAAACMAGS